jgi:hypothetical protein
MFISISIALLQQMSYGNDEYMLIVMNLNLLIALYKLCNNHESC